MKTYTHEELKDILAKHKLWLETNREKGERADFSYSDLSYSDLSNSDLLYSDLRNSDLRGSNLRGSNLSYSNLSYSDLSNSNLSDSNLSGSDLSDSDLRYSNLRNSDLRFIKCYYTIGDIVYIGNQGQAQRSITLVKKTRMAFIGCFKGTFNEARKAIREKYGERAEAITGGYGLTLMAMDAIEKEEQE